MVVLVMGYEDSACKCRGCCDAAAVVDAWWEGGGSSRRASTDDGVQLARLGGMKVMKLIHHNVELAGVQ